LAAPGGAYAPKPMIAFGCSITEPEVYRRCAGPGIKLAAEPDSVVFANAAAGSLFRSYNLVLEAAAKLDDLEALVLLHQDTEITDPQFIAKARSALADPEVGVVGCVGAVDVRSIAWWEGSVTWASFSHQYGEAGGGTLDSFTFAGEADGHPPYARTGEVDTVDGFLLVLSPWAVQNVRFDETLGGQLHGYDLDFCLQVREAGRKVITADLKVIHHHSLELVSHPEVWAQAHVAIAEKWEGRMPGIGRPNLAIDDLDWKRRARLAEAEAGATRLERVSTLMKAQARERQLQAEIDVMTSSIGWKLTKPLRIGNKFVRDSRQFARALRIARREKIGLPR
jgi:hypothetical protein